MNFYPISSLFFYRLIFMAWLLFGEGLFLFRMKRKNHFPLRLTAAIILCFGFAAAFPIPTGNSFYTMFMFFCMFIFSYLMTLLCFDANWKTLLFASLCGYTTEHISYELYQGIFNIINATTNIAHGGLYDNETLSLFSGPIEMAVYFISYIVIYWLVFVLCATKIKGSEGLGVKGGTAVILGALFLALDIVFSSMVSYYSTIHYDGIYMGFVAFLNVVCCVAALIGLFQLFYQNRISKNLEVVNELRKEEKSQYELNKQTVDLINIKCHDLKYQIREMGNKTAMSPDVVENITKVINIYDSAIKTGNKALDVVLSQKSLFCSQHQIKFNCIADGSALSFMSESDTYSLFGNIIDNAVEAVKNLDPSKRMITLRIKKVGNLVSISAQNCYEGKITFNDGYPVTQKADARYHGFGLKSIKIVCDKYNGTLSLDSSNQTFTVAILFTIDEKGLQKQAE